VKIRDYLKQENEMFSSVGGGDVILKVTNLSKFNNKDLKKIFSFLGR
jgi:hypothetical protein